MPLPTFFIIGAYKSGTTSLYHYFRQHPDVFMSPVKEPNYFVHRELSEQMQREGQRPKAVSCGEEYRRLFAGRRRERAIGEASPAYLNHTVAAARIREAVPDAKLIAILRQPVDAFYSDHNMRIRDGRPLEGDFLQRFRRVEQQIRQGEVVGPVYHAQLSAYYEKFEASQIRVYLYDDLMRDVQGVMRDAYRFIGVDDGFVPDTQERRNLGGLPRSRWVDRALKRALRSGKLKRIPAARDTLTMLQQANLRPMPALSRELRRELTEVYRDDIEKLAGLLGRDLQAWLR